MRVTLAKRARIMADAALDEALSTQWPNARFSGPGGVQEFAEKILGVELWGWQVEAAENVRKFRHTAVKGGRKIGKDNLGAACALWWYASFPGGKVHLYGPTMAQLNDIIWAEIRQLWHGHGRCVQCKKEDPDGPRPCPHSAMLDGTFAMSADKGLTSADGTRSIKGRTSVDGGGLYGYSGKQLVIFDEAAHIKDVVHEVVMGNLAGSFIRVLSISNPVKTHGWFYEQFHSEASLYKNPDGSSGLFSVPSLESPNIKQRKNIIDGLASIEWLEERRRVWGEGSAPWLWNIMGQFLKASAGQLFTFEGIKIAERAWNARNPREEPGRLRVGLDVAGEGEGGDETVMAPVRGRTCLQFLCLRAAGPEAILTNLLGLIDKWRHPFERGDSCPEVIVDCDGAEGWRVFQRLKAYEADHVDEIHVVKYHGGQRPKGTVGERYAWNRDLLYGGLVEWFRDGGAIPEDLYLLADLVQMRWVDSERGKLCLIHKSEIREQLKGRSPDRADALALATWAEGADVSPVVMPTPEVQPGTGIGDPYGANEASIEAMNPFDALRVFRS